MARVPVRSNITDTLGNPIGAYSQVSVCGPTTYFAGIIGLTPDNEMAGPDVTSQTPQVYRNIQAALATLGMDVRHIAKMTTYLTSASDIAGFYEARADIYRELFPDSVFAPNTLVIVNRLVREDIKVEVEVTAYKGD